MNIHIIAVGGRIMHTLALNLNERGYVVTGSDDEIFEPSKSRLEQANILPSLIGWDSNRITEDLDLVILGMHARADNPELLKAQELGLKIVSYPEFIAEESKDKKKIVVAGSHGKTTTTAMIMHVLSYQEIHFDYLIGAELEGFQRMVKLSDAPIIVIEGDEYLSSIIDRRSKMIHYDADICVVTGVAWDHINVFKTEEEYNKLFETFLLGLSDKAIVFLYAEDRQLNKLYEKYEKKKDLYKYSALEMDEQGDILYNQERYGVKVFGAHNRANMMAALNVCVELGITASEFFAAISSFKGASKRMELMVETPATIIYRDFAHAPSKVKASLEALVENFKDRRVVVFLELHTFSSLNIEFLPKYAGTLDGADESYVYYSQHTLEIKKLRNFDKNTVRSCFENADLNVLSTKEELLSAIRQLRLDNCVIVFMSSGSFDGLDIEGIVDQNL